MPKWQYLILEMSSGQVSEVDPSQTSYGKQAEDLVDREGLGDALDKLGNLGWRLMPNSTLSNDGQLVFERQSPKRTSKKKKTASKKKGWRPHP